MAGCGYPSISLPMKDLVVATLALLLGALGPQSYQESPFDPLWILGTILLVAYSLGQLASLFSLTPMLGWVVAGLLVGNSGFQLMDAQVDDTLRPVRHAAAVWIAFQVGLHVWPLSWLDWRRGGIILASTLGVFFAIALGGVLLAELPWSFALLLAATASLWGAFTGVPTNGQRHLLQVGVVGVAFSLTLLSAVLLWSAVEETAHMNAASFVGRLTLSLVIGSASAATVRFFSLLPQSVHGLLVALLATCFAIAVLFEVVQIPVLPFGFAAGLALAQDARWRRRLRYIMFRVGSVPLLFYFALLGGVLDVRLLNAPASNLFTVILITVGVLILLRGLLTTVYLRLDIEESSRDWGWQLLPRGVLLFELCYATHPGLLDVLVGPQAVLLQQFVACDILVSFLFYVIIARVVRAVSERVRAQSNGLSA